MRSTLKCFIATGLIVSTAMTVSLLSGCSTASKRKPSSTDEDSQAVAIPPVIPGKTTWVYTWTQSPEALSSPQSYLLKSLSAASACVETLSQDKSELGSSPCESNDRAVGPGVYTCDNPFTSHDYGTTLIAVKTVGDSNRIGLMTGRYTPPPANGTLAREITGNKNFDGIMYDFRANDINDRALVIRSSQIVDLSSSYAVMVNGPTATFKKFADHAPFACSATTPLKTVLAKWGDHIDFLATTFDASRDSENNLFRNGAKFDRAGVAAIIASEATLFPTPALEAKLKTMMTRSSEMNDSVNPSACAETEAVSTRACLAQRIFNSLIEENGTPNRPTYIWKFSLLQRSLIELGALDAKTAAGVHSTHSLLTRLVSVVNSDSNRLARASEAYNCMMSIREQMKPTNFASWGEDPQ